MTVEKQIEHGVSIKHEADGTLDGIAGEIAAMFHAAKMEGVPDRTRTLVLHIDRWQSDMTHLDLVATWREPVGLHQEA